jgi:hypothetical protein
VTVVLPTKPSYTNDAGQAVYWIEGAARGSRGPAEIELLVVHHTAGRDSREYLAQNPVNSSSTYLIGEYPDLGGAVRVYKYMSEATAAPYTQGFGSLGGYPLRPEIPHDNINRRCVSIEIEGPPISAKLQQEAAKLAGSILRYWRGQGRHLLLVGHKHIDDRKIDPDLNWGQFVAQVYEAAK